MGILIYSQEEARRNAFAVKKFEEHLGVRLVTPDYDGDCKFVINRTNDYKIAEKFEARGIRVFNPSRLSELANNKQLCYDFMEKNGIEIMPTRYRKPPFVKKSVDGHGGAGVVICTHEGEYDENFVCQKLASDIGKDLRVWIIGGEIVASVLRTSRSDFRSNYCLGGDAVPYNLSNQEIAHIKKITALLDGDYYGVDFVFNKGKIVFNEIEDTVGARRVYDTTDIDILKLYCEHIKNALD